MANNIYQMFSAGRQQGAERKRQRTLADFMQPAISGDQDALRQVYSADPNAGMQVQQHVTGQQKDAKDEFGKLSAAVASTKNPQLLGQWVQAGQAAGVLPREGAPDFNDPADLEGALKTAEAYAMAYGSAKGGEQYTLSPGAARYDASGQLIAERPFAPVKPSYQWTDQGLVAVQGSAAQPVEYGAPAQSGPSGGASSLLEAVMMQESGGDPNAVSPKGARGLMQIMPGTGKDPGFGVAPMRDDSPQENMRVGRDYLNAMLERYQGNEQLALAAYNAGPGRVDQALQQAGNDPQRAIAMLPAETRNYVPSVQQRAQGGQQGGNRVMPAPKGGDKPSALQERLQIAREMGATDDELRQIAIGREGAAAGAKPLPVSALRIVKEETDAANTATQINSTIQGHLQNIESGKLDFGMLSNWINKGKLAAGIGDEEARNFQEFQSDLEKLRNDSLRLNNGVQTDGDAQRAWNELVANLNDAGYVKQRLQTILRLNERAARLRRENVEMVLSNYGRGEDQQAAPQAPQQSGGSDVDALLGKYGIQ